MRKKRIILSMVVFGGLGLTFGILNGDDHQNTVWKEVPIVEGKFVSNTIKNKFDLKNIVSNADYVFCGTVVNKQEFEVSWNDDSGENWGPSLVLL